MPQWGINVWLEQKVLRNLSIKLAGVSYGFRYEGTRTQLKPQLTINCFRKISPTDSHSSLLSSVFSTTVGADAEAVGGT